MPNEYPAGALSAPPPAPDSLLDALASAGVSFSVTTAERAEHARDWWPLSIPEVARGHVARWPGVVVRPRSTAEVASTLRAANDARIPVTAQGGRSSVVGGAAPAPGAIALDLTGLNAVIALDAISGTVRAQCGVFGPSLEHFLRDRGFTAGHQPQSFELSTVGGWIACRGAGQLSNRYGKVEDLVRALTVVLANGEVIALGGRAPREASGPDLLQLFVGSEGTLGIITEATLVVRALPAFERRRAYEFSSFVEGMRACRRVLQRDAHPAVLRLYDETESRRHFEIDGCALIVLDEGDPSLVAATMAIVHEECVSANELDVSVVERWLQRRNDVSGLAELWAGGLVVDTIEVAGAWAILEALRERVSASLNAHEGVLNVSVHQSHAYLDGACLYFSFAARGGDDPGQLYRAAWDGAMEEVLAVGGAISHHHGAGRARARFVADSLGGGFAVLEGLKEQLDPNHILNPGVLGLGGPSW